MSCFAFHKARGARGAEAVFAKRELRAAGAASACKRETVQPTLVLHAAARSAATCPHSVWARSSGIDSRKEVHE